MDEELRVSKGKTEVGSGLLIWLSFPTDIWEHAGIVWHVVSLISGVCWGPGAAESLHKSPSGSSSLTCLIPQFTPCKTKAQSLCFTRTHSTEGKEGTDEGCNMAWQLSYTVKWTGLRAAWGISTGHLWVCLRHALECSTWSLALSTLVLFPVLLPTHHELCSFSPACLSVMRFLPWRRFTMDWTV